MSNRRSVSAHALECRLLSLVAVFAFLGGAHGQSEPKQPDELKHAIAMVRSGDFNLVHVREIAEAHAVQAIPALEQQFARTEDEDKKESIASALVRLGDNDDNYWAFLLKQATLAAESDAPPQSRYDAQGKLIPGPSPEFVSWAEAHGLNTDAALYAAMHRLPDDVLYLAETRDPRGVPLLRQALSSSNFMVQVFAARGLAIIQDKASLPLILEACKRAPSDVAAAIVLNSLIHLDDTEAQKAVEMYLPKDTVKAIRDERSKSGNKLPD